MHKLACLSFAVSFLVFMIKVHVLDDTCSGDSPRLLYAVQARRQTVPRALPSGEHVLPAARAAASLASPSSTNPSNNSSIETKSNSNSGWSAIQDFITGPDPAAPLSKDQFYQRLATCPEAQLPQVQQLVTVTFTEEAIPLSSSSAPLPHLQAPALQEGPEDEFSDAQSGVSPRAGSRGRSHDKDEFYDASDFTAAEVSSSSCSAQLGDAGWQTTEPLKIRSSSANSSNGNSTSGGSLSSQPRVQVDEFLVVAALGGGAVRDMAVDPAHRSMKFIPWGGVAAHLRRDGVSTASFLTSPSSTAANAAEGTGADGHYEPSTTGSAKSRSLVEATTSNNHLQQQRSRNRGFFPVKQRSGKAFCFLPLPVDTQLPVHVNGYFELSSNRRDIWFGQDMSGDGARRSEWNKVRIPLKSRRHQDCAFCTHSQTTPYL